MSSWRDTTDYRDWRDGVVERDGECMCCGSKDSLHAHHIKHATYFPKLRFVLSNGITLCKLCHMILHNKFAGGYRKLCREVHLERMLFVMQAFSTPDGYLDPPGGGLIIPRA